MIVFGFEAGTWAAEYARKAGRPGSIPKEQVEKEELAIRRFMVPKEDPLSVGDLKKRLKQTMERDVFVVREKEGLERALREVDAIEADVPRIQVPSFTRFNLEWLRAIEFPFLVEAARIVASSALFREESRGFHFRSDFPHEDNGRWLRHSLVKLEQGKPVMGSAPIILDHMKPETAHG
jgi:succinate dehydrogenase/fumarate reductase flavoprotein subunit